jgi:pyridoxal 5'-phosphate synthase pdxT subunit
VIGVLALQGDVREHVAALGDVGCQTRLVRRVADVAGAGADGDAALSGLVLPGGESTTLSMLLESTGLFDVLSGLLRDGLPVLGTCAGLVLLASDVLDGRPDQRFFSVLGATVRRNGYGRQLQSFETEVELASGPPDLPAVFIRAPVIVDVAPGVEVLAAHDGVPVLVRQGPVLASSFHPELTGDRRVHRLFAALCGEGEGE